MWYWEIIDLKVELMCQFLINEGLKTNDSSSWSIVCISLMNLYRVGNGAWSHPQEEASAETGWGQLLWLKCL